MQKLLLTAAAIVFTTAVPALGQTISGVRLFMHFIPHATTPLTQQLDNGWTYAISDPNACGVQILLPWSDVENGSPGAYDWSDLDGLISQWAAKGKRVGITLTSVAGNVDQERGTTLDTPSYVMSSGEQILQCIENPPVPPTPDYLDSRYSTPWRNFITAALARYQDNPDVAFFDIGIGANESFPVAREDSTCQNILNNARPSINYTSWTNYAIGLVDYVASLNPHVQVFFDLNDQSLIGAETADFMTAVAAEAHKFGLGVGNDGFGFNWTTQGLNSKHTAYFESGGKLYPNAPLWYAESASVANQGGLSAFPAVLGEAASLGLPKLHVYAQEWDIAYDPKNSNYAKYHAAYQAAFNSVSPVSGPACRIGAGQP
jgi:hypothetical protein